jgi:hypothetical protein
VTWVKVRGVVGHKPLLRRLEMFSCHVTGSDISRTTTGITNATIILKVTLLFKVAVATVWTEIIVVTVMEGHYHSSVMTCD